MEAWVGDVDQRLGAWVDLGGDVEAGGGVGRRLGAWVGLGR